MSERERVENAIRAAFDEQMRDGTVGITDDDEIMFSVERMADSVLAALEQRAYNLRGQLDYMTSEIAKVLGVPATSPADTVQYVRELVDMIGNLDNKTIRGWAQWADDENWLFEVTDSPSMAQDPAILVLLPADV